MKISVVVPVHNELGGLAELVDEAESALTGLDFEVICVNDHSSDGSGELLDALEAERPWLVVVHLAANFGQTAAMAAGIDQADGDVIVLMDGDGQNDPADISQLVSLIAEGYDVVSGWRRHRHEPIRRRLASLLANGLLRRVSGVSLHDSGCSLKAYRAELLKSLTLLRDDHRFLPALAGGLGAKVAEVAVTDRPRRHGQTHYGLARVPRVAADLFGLWMLLRFRGRPLRAFTWLGVMGAVAWLVLAGAAAAFGSPTTALLCIGLSGTVLVGACAYGASVEERERRDRWALYRIERSTRDADQPLLDRK